MSNLAEFVSRSKAREKNINSKKYVVEDLVSAHNDAVRLLEMAQQLKDQLSKQHEKVAVYTQESETKKTPVEEEAPFDVATWQMTYPSIK